MSVFDNLFLDEHNETTEDAPHTESLFDFKEPEAEETTEAEVEEHEESADKSADAPEKAAEVEAPVQKTLTYEDLDTFLNKKYETELQRKQLEAYQQEMAKASKVEEPKMPDPLYQPEEYRQWIFDQNKATEQRYEARLEQLQTQMIVDNITSQMDKTIGDAKAKYGEEKFKAAEQWAADVARKDRVGALNYLKSNPSWLHIVELYNKEQDAIEYNKDPEAFLERKLTERQAKANEAEVETTEVAAPVKKKPVKSINNVSSNTREPEEEVPAFFKGLF